MITRVRCLGSASQWGDDGECHGWEVAAGGRWRRPETDEARALVGRARALLAVLPPQPAACNCSAKARRTSA